MKAILFCVQAFKGRETQFQSFENLKVITLWQNSILGSKDPLEPYWYLLFLSINVPLNFL